MAGAILDTRAGSDSSTCMELENPPLEFEPWSEGRLELTLVCERIGLLFAVLAGIEARVESVAAEVALEVDRLAALSCLAC
jgi:hypothetical protein